MVGAWQAGFYEDDEGYWLLIDQSGLYRLTTEDGTFLENGGILVEGDVAHFVVEGATEAQSFQWGISELEEYGYVITQLYLDDRAWTKAE